MVIVAVESWKTIFWRFGFQTPLGAKSRGLRRQAKPLGKIKIAAASRSRGGAGYYAAARRANRKPSVYFRFIPCKIYR